MNIKRFIFLVGIVFVMFSTAAAQKNGVYNGQGKFICEKCTVKKVALDSGYRNYALRSLPGPYQENSVVYECLSNKPILVVNNKSAEVPDELSAFKKMPYAGTDLFFDDVKRMIKEKALFDIFLVKAIGRPSSVSETASGRDKIKVWTYSKLGLTVYFSDGVAVKYDRHM